MHLGAFIYLAVVTVVVASVRATFAALSKAPTFKVGFRSTIRRKQLSYARALPVAVCVFQSYELLHVETVTHQECTIVWELKYFRTHSNVRIFSS